MANEESLARLRSELEKLTEQDFQYLQSTYRDNLWWFPSLPTPAGTSTVDAVIEALRRVETSLELLTLTLTNVVRHLLNGRSDDQLDNPMAPICEEAPQPSSSKHGMSPNEYTAMEEIPVDYTPREASAPGFSNNSLPGIGYADMEGTTPYSSPSEASQPGCSKGSKPGFKFQNFSGDLPEDEETYDIGSDPGSPNEKPTEIVALECEESDSALRSPQEIFDFALREIRELSQCISDLNNRNVTERTHQKKCRQMRIEIEELITDTTDDQSERTRMRMALREAFAYNCPLFEWDQDIGGNHSVDRTVPKNSGKKSAAAKRRSGNTNADDDKFQNVGKNPSMKKTARKNSQKRKIAASELGSADNSPEYRMLQDLWSTLDESSQSDMEIMKKHLENTYEERLKYYCGSLPMFFFQEELLCKEAELRFGSEISILEEKLVDAVRVFSEDDELFPRTSSGNQQRQATFIDVCRFLEEGDDPPLITEAPVDTEKAIGIDDSPNMVAWHPNFKIYISSPKGVISLTDNRLERVLVYCLAVYYIMDLGYPRAYQRVLYVLQTLLFPSDRLPDIPVTANMRYFLDLLERELRSKREPQSH